MRIILFADSTEYGGAEKYIETIFDYFSSQKDKEVFLLCPKPEIFIRLRSRDNKRIISIKNKPVFSPRWCLTIKPLLKAFKNIKPDIILLNMSHPYCCEAAILAAGRIVPKNRIASVIHNPEISRAGGYPLIGILRNMIGRFFLKLIGTFICPSNAGKDLFAANFKIEPEKIRVIHNGVDINTSGVPEKGVIIKEFGLQGKKIVLCVSRLVKRKGLEILIPAFKKVSAVIKDSVLLIVGEGYLKEKLQKQAFKEDMSGIIIFTGFRQDVEKFYSAAGVVVVPSFYEMLPSVVTEAMAFGKPIVATDVGGIPELLADTGILVGAKDIENISSAIIKVLKNEALANELGNKARQRALSYFSLPRFFRDFEQTLDELSTY
jgi:glycosyltransferase involved in cell wall biosynthesis